MKNTIWTTAVIILLSVSACQISTEYNESSVEENKKISAMFHDRNLEEIDVVMADNFLATYYHSDSKLRTWDKEIHKNAIINRPDIKDSIILEIAEGNWVATRLIRTSIENGGVKKTEILQMKKIQDGKITELFEIFSPPQYIPNETGPEE
jgi:predicted SnoaL-like aldol condensation-catalyzing enzyme